MALACSCLSCGVSSGRAGIKAIWILSFYCVLRLIARAISAALTVLFVLGGVFVGGVAGAFAGWISNGGVIRGVTVVSIAGASISLEFLDAVRSHWCSGYLGLYSSSSMADFLQDLLHGRFVNEHIEELQLATSRTYDLQLNHSSTSYGVSNAPQGEVAAPGLSMDSLNKLPCHVLSDEMKAVQETCCTICLQDIAVGDTARCLPQCNHMFHLTCVDKWLVIRSSCSVCRQEVWILNTIIAYCNCVHC